MLVVGIHVVVAAAVVVVVVVHFPSFLVDGIQRRQNFFQPFVNVIESLFNDDQTFRMHFHSVFGSTTRICVASTDSIFHVRVV